MKWQVSSDGNINDFENGGLIAFLPEGTTEETANIIALAPELKDAAQDFINGVDSNKMKARQMYNRFKALLDKIPTY